MKQFFSLVINHEYDRVDENTRSVSNDLAIVPAITNDPYIKNNRLLFQVKTGGLICYIEDHDETFKNETPVLFFWVVCTNEAFYSYTDYPNHINFSDPYYYWSNSEESTSLQQNEFHDLGQGVPPTNAIGCIGISIIDIDTTKQLKFTVDFKVRKTYWEYHIITRTEQKDWKYKIEDAYGEWYFEQVENDNPSETIFQSIIPLPYFKKAKGRLELVWEPEPNNRIQEN